jgi:hypothetical protein
VAKGKALIEKGVGTQAPSASQLGQQAVTKTVNYRRTGECVGTATLLYRDRTGLEHLGILAPSKKAGAAASSKGGGGGGKDVKPDVKPAGKSGEQCHACS